MMDNKYIDYYTTSVLKCTGNYTDFNKLFKNIQVQG